METVAEAPGGQKVKDCPVKDSRSEARCLHGRIIAVGKNWKHRKRHIMLVKNIYPNSGGRANDVVGALHAPATSTAHGGGGGGGRRRRRRRPGGGFGGGGFGGGGFHGGGFGGGGFGGGGSAEAASAVLAAEATPGFPATAAPEASHPPLSTAANFRRPPAASAEIAVQLLRRNRLQSRQLRQLNGRYGNYFNHGFYGSRGLQRVRGIRRVRRDTDTAWADTGLGAALGFGLGQSVCVLGI